jgi:hypothetical protein
MKFKCLCGQLLSDSTDDIPYKARLIADGDWNAFTKSCESPQGYDWHLVTNIYQCPQCGRLRIEKPPGQVFFFEPENESVSKSLFRFIGTTKK